MNRLDRRRLLQFLMIGALAPAIMPRTAMASPVAGVLISPPDGEMRFQRAVSRGAHDNSQFTVTREFAVRFDRFADGFVVDGRQVGVEVSAPPPLAAFAELERGRTENSLFPLILDPFGRIITEAQGRSRESEVDMAFALAMRQIAAQPLAADDRAQLRSFVNAIHQTGQNVASQMPQDLFAPEQPARIEGQDIPLPTGDVGRLTSRFDAERDQQTGLMRRAMREIVTQIEGDQRRTVEHWQLASAVGE